MNVIYQDLGLHAQLACLWEATARKPGNVHRFMDFEDTNYLDFLASAAAIAPVFDAALSQSVGEIVLAGVAATRRVSRANTNLGILLLLAPLAKVTTTTNLPEVLDSLTLADAKLVYQSIRLAQPGGLGSVEEGDVIREPDRGLRELMALAADRDMVAKQYATGFTDILTLGVPAIEQGVTRTGCLEGGIIEAQLVLMSRHPDTLIARKLGWAEAEHAAEKAYEVLHSGWPDSDLGRHQLANFDLWLRENGNSRNPGTTADLLAASLFWMLRQGIISLPYDVPWTRDGITL